MLKNYTTSLLLTTCLVMAGCSSTPDEEDIATLGLPEGTIASGSLVERDYVLNSALDQISQQLETSAKCHVESYEPYIKTNPDDSDEKQQWQELWLIRGCDQVFPITLTFYKDTKTNEVSYKVEK